MRWQDIGNKPAGVGRNRIYASDAEKQKAYRERLKRYGIREK